MYMDLKICSFVLIGMYKSAVLSLSMGKKLDFFEKIYIFVILGYELPIRTYFEKIWQLFWGGFDYYLDFDYFLENYVVHDSQWQVHLRRSNIYFKLSYIVLLHQKHLKSLSLWFSEILGYFQKALAILCTRETRIDFFGQKFESCNLFQTRYTYQINLWGNWELKGSS